MGSCKGYLRFPNIMSALALMISASAVVFSVITWCYNYEERKPNLTASCGGGYYISFPDGYMTLDNDREIDAFFIYEITITNRSSRHDWLEKVSLYEMNISGPGVISKNDSIAIDKNTINKIISKSQDDYMLIDHFLDNHNVLYEEGTMIYEAAYGNKLNWALTYENAFLEPYESIDVYYAFVIINYTGNPRFGRTIFNITNTRGSLLPKLECKQPTYVKRKNRGKQ